VIARIMGEGQLRIDDSQLEELNALDDALSAAIEGGNDDEFRNALSALLAAVRSRGTPVADDLLVDSDLVLPYEDAHVDEVRALLSGEGLIPG
jgi:hypothetical protein